MWKRILCIVIVLFSPVGVLAQTPVTSYPAGWSPIGATVTLAVTGTTSSVQLGWAAVKPLPIPAPANVQVCNKGTVDASVALGNSSITATTANYVVLAGACPLMALNGAQYIAAISNPSGTTSLTISTGNGSASNSSSPGGGAAPGNCGGIPCMANTGVNATAGALDAIAAKASGRLNLLSASPSVASLGLNISQITNSSAVYSTLPAVPQAFGGNIYPYNNISVVDSLATASGSDFIVGALVGCTYNSTNISGSRVCNQSLVTFSGPTSPTNTLDFIQAQGSLLNVNSTDGGTSGTHRGSMVAGGDAVVINSGAGYFAQFTGREIDVSSVAGSLPSTFKIGLNIVSLGNDVVQATNISAGINIGGGGGAGFLDGIIFSHLTGAYGVPSTGELIGVEDDTAVTFAGGVDLGLQSGSNITYTNFALRSPGFKVDGGGVINGSGLTITGNVAFTGTANSSIPFVQASTTNGQSFGPLIFAGTNSSDTAFKIENAAGNTQYFVIGGDGKAYFGAIPAASGVDILCYNPTGGAVTYASTVVGCVPSSLRFKNPKRAVGDSGALAGILSLTPSVYSYKREMNLGDNDQIGVYAEQVCAIDELLCHRDAQGHPDNYDKIGLTAYLIGAVKAQEMKIEKLEKR